LLVERGMASSRSQAQRLIAAGVRWLGRGGWQRVTKNGDELPPQAQIELVDAAEARYVSRGGLKLEGALAATGLRPAGRLCLDAGQSTGGFTDCLLRQGAVQVVGIDVGYGQLHPSLRADPRVLCLERINLRSVVADDLPVSPFDLIVGDLSFISLTLVLPALVGLLAPAGDLLLLVKPQFELQPGQVGKGGIVREPALHAVVQERLRQACASLELQVVGWHDSPIAGGDGNREFFLHARHGA
jgi:23S rRNA (cytidine1920-2'-O)/16S rRNA (cytidine1409-2'-O)-methyltransferase